MFFGILQKIPKIQKRQIWGASITICSQQEAIQLYMFAANMCSQPTCRRVVCSRTTWPVGGCAHAAGGGRVGCEHVACEHVACEHVGCE